MYILSWSYFVRKRKKKIKQMGHALVNNCFMKCHFCMAFLLQNVFGIAMEEKKETSKSIDSEDRKHTDEFMLAWKSIILYLHACMTHLCFFVCAIYRKYTVLLQFIFGKHYFYYFSCVDVVYFIFLSLYLITIKL